MISIDWAHTKELVLYDGEKIIRADKKNLAKHLNGDSVVIEQGAPISLSWFIFRKCPLYFINPKRVAEYRDTNNLEKSDDIDAKIIWELAQNRNNLIAVSLNEKETNLTMLYHLYLTHQKARVALSNQLKGAKRYYGSVLGEQLSDMELAFNQLKSKETSLLTEMRKSTPEQPEGIARIKGIGPRLWAGIICIANPRNFSSVNPYLKYCGLIDHKNINYNYNRDARSIYWLISDQIVRQRTPKYREFYDEVKIKLVKTHPDWKPCRVNGVALNRLATKLAKDIYSILRVRLGEEVD